MRRERHFDSSPRVQQCGRSADDIHVPRSVRNSIRVIVDLSSGLGLLAILLLPWLHVSNVNPFEVGSRLYQLGTPLLMVGLIVTTALAVVVAQVLDRGVWTSLLLCVSGAGTTLLCISVMASLSLTESLIADHEPKQLGYSLTFVSGLVVLGAGIFGMILNYRTGGGRETAS